MYEFFEHTADLGLRVRARDLNGLFRDAAMGLFAMVVEEVPRGRTASSREIAIRGRRRDYLLFDWLNELLYLFETERLLLGEFDVDVTESGVVAGMHAWPWDESVDRPLHEVKAITYHGLTVKPVDDGWLAEVIVDI